MKIRHIAAVGLAAIACLAQAVTPDDDAALEAQASLAMASGEQISVAEFSALVEAAMAATKTPGVGIALINDGEVVFEKAYGVENVASNAPLTTRSVFEAASLSKPLFGFFAMTFVEEGVLDLDRPLAEYLPNPAMAHDDRYRAMTARHVLAHQTGLPNWRTDDRESGLAFKFAPGEGFFYSGEGYEYLAEVLAHLAETDDAGLEALFQQRIAQPLGMTRTRFIATGDQLLDRATPHRDGDPIRLKAADPSFGAAYSVHSDAGDYIRFLAGVLRGDVLTPESYAAFLAPQGSAIPAGDPNRAFGLTDWALGFSVYDLPIGRFYAHGGNNPGYSSLVFLSRELNWGVAILTNADQANAMLMAVAAKLSGLELG
ncbi:MAG: serine hydrolase domain-containing protein [Pseudomonadota bacterium]